MSINISSQYIQLKWALAFMMILGHARENTLLAWEGLMWTLSAIIPILPVFCSALLFCTKWLHFCSLHCVWAWLRDKWTDLWNTKGNSAKLLRRTTSTKSIPFSTALHQNWCSTHIPLLPSLYSCCVIRILHYNDNNIFCFTSILPSISPFSPLPSCFHTCM